MLKESLFFSIIKKSLTKEELNIINIDLYNSFKENIINEDDITLVINKSIEESIKTILLLRR